MSLNAIGLGEMAIESSLDQPFSAEIELIDVGSAPLVGIKVRVADPENFEQIGLERLAVLSLLNFRIEKNAKGKIVIKVQSMERMTEPYMELVVDLIWPEGQLYKAFTVLLDPPGYQLASSKAQSSPIYYKKASINHMVAPLYMNGQTMSTDSQVNTNSPINNSNIQGIPKFTMQDITPSQETMPKFIPTNSAVSLAKTNQKQQAIQNNKPLNSEQDSMIKPEISIITAAVGYVRESNALLMDQLRWFQDQNKKLQIQLEKRDKERELVQAQMQVLMKKPLAVASQASSPPSNNNSLSFWPLLLLLAVAAGGVGLAYRYFKIREEEANIEPYLSNISAESKLFMPEVEQVLKTTKSTEDQADDKEKSLDFVLANPLKSKAALDTLVALAKTYIDMGELESARTCLDEVMESGNENQKIKAKRLLDGIKDK